MKSKNSRRNFLAKSTLAGMAALSVPFLHVQIPRNLKAMQLLKGLN